MNTAQISACQPGIYVKNISQLQRRHSKPCVLPMSANSFSGISLNLRGKPSFGIKCRPISKYRKPLHICSAGGSEMENNVEDSPWKSLEKAMEKFKGPSIEDVLRQQINKGEYLQDGGSGAKPPGGGSGGGGGGPDGSGEFDEEESPAEIFDEYLQMIFGTLGFIFLYIYILMGEELTKLARDYIKYKLWGSQSVRLKNAGYRWEQFLDKIAIYEETQKDWLEQAIEDTPTWWHNPDYYQEVANDLISASSNESVSNEYEDDDPNSNDDDSFYD